LPLQADDRSTAADFDVVAMCSNAQDVECLAARGLKFNASMELSYRFQTIQGQSLALPCDPG